MLDWFHSICYRPPIQRELTSSSSFITLPQSAIVSWNEVRSLGYIKRVRYLLYCHFQGPFTQSVRVNFWKNCLMALVWSCSHRKLMEPLENWLQPHSWVTPLFSMRKVSLASSQSCWVLMLTLGVNGPLWCIHTEQSRNRDRSRDRNQNNEEQ